MDFTIRFLFLLILLICGRTNSDRGMYLYGRSTCRYLRDLGISFKRQHNAPRFRKFKGDVQRLLEKTIQHGLADRLFRLRVLMPLGIDKMENLPVSSLSGGEMQR
eukprot:COSAG05_NODE_650_length_8102_cov_16.263383_7_plen_105_part_00